MKTKTFNNLFWDFNLKNDEALELEDKLYKAKEEARLLKEEILNEPKLHETLTTIGIIHDKKLYRKKQCNPIVGSTYYLDIQDYIEPVQSFQLDSKLGDNNE